MREGVLWTNLSRRELSRRLCEMGTPAGRYVVRKLLKKSGMGQRTARKKKSMGAHPDRNAQFEKIAKLKAQYAANAEPVISMDSKKKELIGNFSRAGHTHTQAPVETLDHDFPSAAQCQKTIPMPSACCCCVTEVAAMHLTGMSSRKNCRNWRIDWA